MARTPSIPTQIFLGFGLLSAAIVALGVFNLRLHEQSASSMRRLHEGYLPLALTIGECQASQGVFVTLLSDVLTRSRADIDREWLEIARRTRPATLRRAIHGAARVARMADTLQERRTAESIGENLRVVEQRFTTSSVAIDGMLEAVLRDDFARANRELARAKWLEVDAQRRLRDLHILLEARSAAVARRAAENEERAAASTSVATLLGLCLGLFVTYLAYRLLAPLPRLHARVGAVARGEFSNPLTPVRDDELGRLTAEFEGMVKALSTRDRNLRDAADQLERLHRMQGEILESLRSAVVVVDAEDRVRVMNHAATSLLDATTADVGRPIAAVHGLAVIEGLAEAIASVRTTGAPVARNALPSPGERRIDVRASPFSQLEAGRQGAVLLVLDDVTAELATEARLVSSERLAAIGRMAAHVTHEIRNPLSSIALNVEMLEDEVPREEGEARALLRAIQREIDRLTGLTEEYLRLARLPLPRLEPTDLGHLVDEVARFVRPELERDGVWLDVELPQHPVELPADEAQLRQTLLNLLRNAREAMPDGGRVRLAVSATDRSVTLRVEDEGVGLEPASASRIFDAFYTTKADGTGLGLALVAQIVASHGGRISVEPNTPRGTCFVLCLPIEAASDNAAARSEAHA